MTIHLVIPNSNTSNNIYSFSEALYLSGYLKKYRINVHTIFINTNDIESFKSLNNKNIILISMWDGKELINWFQNFQTYSDPKRFIFFGLTAQNYGKEIKNSFNLKCEIINSYRYKDIIKILLDDVEFNNTQSEELSYLDPSLSQIDDLPIIPIIASRGCPNRCNFCAVNCSCEPHQEYCMRPAEDVYNDIACLVKRGKSIFYFVDSCFITKDKTNLKRIKFLCELIIKNKLNISFYIETRVDCIEESLFVLLKKAGLRRVLLGVENFNDNVLKRYNKNIQFYQIINSINILKNLSINIDITLIMFDPLTSKSELIDNLNAIIDNDIYRYVDIVGIFRRMILLPKHKIKELGKEITYGEFDLSVPEWMNYSYNYKIMDLEVSCLEHVINIGIKHFKQVQKEFLTNIQEIKKKLSFKEQSTKDFLIIIREMILKEYYSMDNYLQNRINSYFNELEKNNYE